MSYTNLPVGSRTVSHRVQLARLGYEVPPNYLRVRVKASDTNLAGLPLENTLLIPEGAPDPYITTSDVGLQPITYTFLKGMTPSNGGITLTTPGPVSGDYSRFAVSRYFVPTPTDMGSTAVQAVFEWVSDFYEYFVVGLAPVSSLNAIKNSNVANGNNMLTNFRYSAYSYYVDVAIPGVFANNFSVQPYQNNRFRIEVFADEQVFFINGAEVGRYSVPFTQDLMFVVSTGYQNSHLDQTTCYIANPGDLGVLIPEPDPVVFLSANHAPLNNSISTAFIAPTTETYIYYVDDVEAGSVSAYAGTNYGFIDSADTYLTPDVEEVTVRVETADGSRVSNELVVAKMIAPTATLNSISETPSSYIFSITAESEGSLTLTVYGAGYFTLPQTTGTFDYEITKQTLFQYIGPGDPNFSISDGDTGTMLCPDLYYHINTPETPSISVVSLVNDVLTVNIESSGYSDFYIYANNYYVGNGTAFEGQPYQHIERKGYVVDPSVTLDLWAVNRYTSIDSNHVYTDFTVVSGGTSGNISGSTVVQGITNIYQDVYGTYLYGDVTILTGATFDFLVNNDLVTSGSVLSVGTTQQSFYFDYSQFLLGNTGATNSVTLEMRNTDTGESLYYQVPVTDVPSGAVDSIVLSGTSLNIAYQVDQPVQVSIKLGQSLTLGTANCSSGGSYNLSVDMSFIMQNYGPTTTLGIDLFNETGNTPIPNSSLALNVTYNPPVLTNISSGGTMYLVATSDIPDNYAPFDVVINGVTRESGAAGPGQPFTFTVPITGAMDVYTVNPYDSTESNHIVV